MVRCVDCRKLKSVSWGKTLMIVKGRNDERSLETFYIAPKDYAKASPLGLLAVLRCEEKGCLSEDWNIYKERRCESFTTVEKGKSRGAEVERF